MRRFDPSSVEIDFTRDILIILHDVFPMLAEHRPEFHDICTYVARASIVQPRGSVYHLTRRAYVFDGYYNLVMMLYDLTEEDVEYIRFCAGQKFPPERNLYHLLGDESGSFEERLARADKDIDPNFEQYIAVLQGDRIVFNRKITSEVLINLAYRFKKKDRVRRYWDEAFAASQRVNAQMQLPDPLMPKSNV